MLLTSTTNGGIRSAAELVDLAVGHQGQTVSVGAPPAVVDGFLAAALEPVPLDAVYTSDLNRARESAEPVAAAAGLIPVVMPELREIFLGDLEGMTLDRVHAEHDPFVPWLEVAFNGRFPSREFH